MYIVHNMQVKVQNYLLRNPPKAIPILILSFPILFPLQGLALQTGFFQSWSFWKYLLQFPHSAESPWHRSYPVAAESNEIRPIK